MIVGEIVRWRGDEGDYHVTLLRLGHKWARVRFFGPGVRHEDGTRTPREKNVPVTEIEPPLWGKR